MNTADQLAAALRAARAAAAYNNQENPETSEIALPGLGVAWMEQAHEALARHDAERQGRELYVILSQNGPPAITESQRAARYWERKGNKVRTIMVDSGEPQAHGYVDEG